MMANDQSKVLLPFQRFALVKAAEAYQQAASLYLRIASEPIHARPTQAGVDGKDCPTPPGTNAERWSK